MKRAPLGAPFRFVGLGPLDGRVFHERQRAAGSERQEREQERQGPHWAAPSSYHQTSGSHGGMSPKSGMVSGCLSSSAWAMSAAFHW